VRLACPRRAPRLPVGVPASRVDENGALRADESSFLRDVWFLAGTRASAPERVRREDFQLPPASAFLATVPEQKQPHSQREDFKMPHASAFFA